MTFATIIIWCPFPSLFSQTCDDGSSPVVQTQSLAGMESWDNYNDPDNDVVALCGFPANGNIVGGQHDGIALSPVGASWCSEVRFRVGSVFLTPANGENHGSPCANNYSGGGPSLFQDLGIVFTASAAGCVDIQIFETFDDNPNAIDADVTAGSITLYGCPQNSVLPIELNFFRAKTAGPSNLISWETITETKSAWQVIERSSDGFSDWTEVGRKEGQGDSDEPVIYELFDENPFPQTYYRLREISLDGMHQFSQTISVKRPTEGFSIRSISPQPAHDRATVRFQIPVFGMVSFELFDALGKKVRSGKMEFEAGQNTFELDLHDLPRGNYFLALTHANERQTANLNLGGF